MLADKKLFLFDIDGTLAIGDTLYDGTADLIAHIRRIGGKAYYITNNSTKSGADYVHKFASCFGIDTTEDLFITSGYMTIRFLKEHYGNDKIFVLGTSSFVSELRRAGLTVTEGAEADIACAVAAFDNELTYRKLENICEVLSTQDIPFYATNPDLCCPVPFGFVPDCGAICKMITYSVRREPIYLGKPSREVVELCLHASGFSPEQTIVVGDRLYTDIACGINGGVDTCVVYTGEARPEDMSDTPYPPTYAFENIRAFYLACRTT